MWRRGKRLSFEAGLREVCNPVEDGAIEADQAGTFRRPAEELGLSELRYAVEVRALELRETEEFRSNELHAVAERRTRETAAVEEPGVTEPRRAGDL